MVKKYKNAFKLAKPYYMKKGLTPEQRYIAMKAIGAHRSRYGNCSESSVGDKRVHMDVDPMSDAELSDDQSNWPAWEDLKDPAYNRDSFDERKHMPFLSDVLLIILTQQIGFIETLE